ncbi:MAG: DUF2971 domain-containing protein [Clostridia bacterium]|nr:DUF2971 domain-containing protein [Clostridia bacterium]
MAFDFRKELQNRMDEENGWLCDFELRTYSEELIDNRSDIPRLYRYMPANYNNIRCLETKELYLSKIGAMNDIFEMLGGVADTKTVKALEGLSDLFYIKSFSERENDLLMWSGYADEFRGMCVEYDLSNMDGSYYYHLFPVVYKDGRYGKACIDQYTSEELQCYKQDNYISEDSELQDIYSAAICKSNRWSGEAEWRMIVSYVQMHEKYNKAGMWEGDFEEQYAISSQYISFPYIKSVCLGPRMEERVKEHIKEIGRRPGGFEVHEMQLDNSDYCLSRKPNKEE